MPEYIFSSTQNALELERLQSIERLFDPASRSRIKSTGIAPGWRCLEVGAGAGAIAQWLGEVVGDNGKVVAVDLDTRFLSNLKSANIKVIETDIRHLPLDRPSFDLIHARYVLIHIQDLPAAISKMLRLLKIGGYLVLEEPNFSASKAISGDELACKSCDRVNQAICQMFAQQNLDWALGLKLPAMLQNLGLEELSIAHDVPISPGGSAIAKIMKMSTIQLSKKYLATGMANQEDLDRYYQFAENPKTWAIYYGTVAVVARKTDY